VQVLRSAKGSETDGKPRKPQAQNSQWKVFNRFMWPILSVLFLGLVILALRSSDDAETVQGESGQGMNARRARVAPPTGLSYRQNEPVSGDNRAGMNPDDASSSDLPPGFKPMRPKPFKSAKGMIVTGADGKGAVNVESARKNPSSDFAIEKIGQQKTRISLKTEKR